jgi:hypothetical protein
MSSKKDLYDSHDPYFIVELPQDSAYNLFLTQK